MALESVAGIRTPHIVTTDYCIYIHWRYDHTRKRFWKIQKRYASAVWFLYLMLLELRLNGYALKVSH